VTEAVATTYAPNSATWPPGPARMSKSRIRLPHPRDGAPDGICLDAEGGVWYGDVPNQRCVRVAEGGEVLQTVELDRGCFACALGGEDRRTLFMVAADWSDPGRMMRERTGLVLAQRVAVPGVSGTSTS
jgi:sugar lactone lactonase YvrE